MYTREGQGEGRGAKPALPDPNRIRNRVLPGGSALPFMQSRAPSDRGSTGPVDQAFNAGRSMSVCIRVV